MKKSFKILQKHFSIERRNTINNYLILVEIENGVPKRSYVAKMNDYKNWDKLMPYYVANEN